MLCAGERHRVSLSLPIRSDVVKRSKSKERGKRDRNIIKDGDLTFQVFPSLKQIQ